MIGGAKCEQMCSMKNSGKCVHNRAGVRDCKQNYAPPTHGIGWTPCTVNRGGACHKNVNKDWKCTQFHEDASDTRDKEKLLTAACKYCQGSYCTEYGPNRGYKPETGGRCDTIVC